MPNAPGIWSQDPWLLNCLNGTLDLRTGELRPHSREDLITLRAEVTYEPGARSPVLEEYLAWVCVGKPGLYEFLQMVAGYSLTGDTREEKLFFLYGPAASGKSTFVEAMKAMLGDYAKVSDFEAFIKKAASGGPKNEIARLDGARFVPSVEVDDGKALAAALIKQLTGGDTVTARFLYQEGKEFKPALKLFLVANNAPAIDPEDDGMWRRILRIPFDRVVPEDQRDPNIKALLTDRAGQG
jgi:putative DNA primase/helicase